MKSFLIVGNAISFTCESIFPFVVNSEMWPGVSHRGMDFILPDGSTKNVNACWFTNLEHNSRKTPLELNSIYDPSKYHRFDTYDAINVDSINDIPSDYYGTIGVPVTYLYRHCPDQFDIIGKLNHNRPESYDFGKSIVDGKGVYARVLIRRIVK